MHGPPRSPAVRLVGSPSAAAVFEFTILRDGELGGVSGGQPVAHLHAVPLLHLRQRAHQSGVGRIQGHDPFFLQHTNRGFIRATCKRITPHDPLYRVTVLLLLPDSRTLTLPRQMERLCLFLRAGQARPPRSPGRLCVLSLFPFGTAGLVITVPRDTRTPCKNDIECYFGTMQHRCQGARLY